VNILGYFLLGIHFLMALMLVGGIMITTTKSEGLGGTIGGGSDTVFRGSSAKGFEAFLERGITYLAWGFLATSFLSAIFAARFL
jgi:protein translocase SecG subunit